LSFTQGVTLSSARYSTASVDDIFVGAGAGGMSRLTIRRGSGAEAAVANKFAAYFSKPNAVLFTAALDLSGKNGKVTNIYGAQGRGGVLGLPSGLAGFAGAGPVSSVGAWNAPLRVASIILKK